MTTFSLFTADDITRHLPELARLLHDCVHEGASIGFIMPHTMHDAEAFWRDKVAGPVASGTRLLLVAHNGERIEGAVQLDYDTPANQPHRAEIRKLLVHPDLRRQGIARAL
ncbi:MAG TPA: GNAT family N-acetyltransferase, partial [Nordella sp.]|nr:GNAT family N-acetyltransferase [Nordella sp.]